MQQEPWVLFVPCLQPLGTPRRCLSGRQQLRVHEAASIDPCSLTCLSCRTFQLRNQTAACALPQQWGRTGLAIPTCSTAIYCKDHETVPNVHARGHEKLRYEWCVCRAHVTYIDRSFRLIFGRWAVELVPSNHWADYIIVVSLRTLKAPKRLTSQHATAARGCHTHSVPQCGPSSKEANWKPVRSMAAE